MIGGVAAPWLLPLVGGVVPAQAQVASVVSQPPIAILLIACPLLPLLLMIFLQRRPPAVTLPRRGLGLRLRP
ncbi:formate hydrogenlyase subunit 3 [Raoultella terrigena]|uniref:Formate hydrogenlyase subunit 3 n=1 Tax=Raoultella terrigena TaxID=577 RepID=A0A4U9D4V7_RAOTE|nr:formate hydrogenlyase subunit 3 [Raoultella terrigena]